MKRILINNLFYRVIDDIADYIEALKKELKDQRAKADILEEDNKQLMAQINANGATKKPLLADAKVGDLCQLRNGEWVQIEHCFGFPDRYRTTDSFTHDNEGKAAGCNNQDFDIIHAEPLAPEGSAEWAWQMWQLGNSVHNTGSSLLWPGDRKVKNVSKEQWLKELASYPTGWQLYEPKPAEPAFASVKEGDYVELRNGKHYKVKKVCLNLWFMLDGFGCDSNARYDFNGLNLYEQLRGSLDVIKILSPAEVVVTIGCLSGTVRSRDNKSFHLLRKGKNTMVIYSDALDTHTRELVQSLLKAQKKGE